MPTWPMQLRGPLSNGLQEPTGTSAYDLDPSIHLYGSKRLAVGPQISSRRPMAKALMYTLSPSVRG